MNERQTAEYKLKKCPMCGGYAYTYFDENGRRLAGIDSFRIGQEDA